MKFQRLGEKKQNKGLAFGLLFLFGLFGLGFNLKNLKLPNLNFSYSPKVVTPLPGDDQIVKLTKILLDKNTDVDFPLGATDSAILARLRDGGEVWFSTNKDFVSQVDLLQIILTRLKIEGKKIKKVDLRFEKPTVVY